MRFQNADCLIPNYVELVKRPTAHIKGIVSEAKTDDGRPATDLLEPQEKVFLAMVENYAPHLSEYANAVFHNIVMRRTNGG